MPRLKNRLSVLAMAMTLAGPLARAGNSGPDASFFRFLTPKVTVSQEQALARFPAFTVGPANGPVVDILFIPGCPHCHDLWENLQKLRYTEPQAAQYRYRWIPILVNLQNAEELSPFWNDSRNGQALASLMSTESSPAHQAGKPKSAANLLAALRPSLVWLRGTGAQIAPALIRENARPATIHLGSPAPSVLNRWLGLPGVLSVPSPESKS